MRKEKSWTRLEYDYAYRHYRLGGDPDKNTWHKICPEIWKSADYSYQAMLYTVHGWSSNLRRARFHQIKWRILSREELPF